MILYAITVFFSIFFVWMASEINDEVLDAPFSVPLLMLAIALPFINILVTTLVFICVFAIKVTEDD